MELQATNASFLVEQVGRGGLGDYCQQAPTTPMVWSCNRLVAVEDKISPVSFRVHEE